MIVLLTLSCFPTFAQSDVTKQKVIEACTNYLDGFYKGDTLKIIQSLSPTMHKFGFWKNKETGLYENDGFMTFEAALDYSRQVLNSNRFIPESAPKKVEVLDIGQSIASAKVTAWWGIDYLLLSRQSNDNWLIEQVLWEGPNN